MNDRRQYLTTEIEKLVNKPRLSKRDKLLLLQYVNERDNIPSLADYIA